MVVSTPKNYHLKKVGSFLFILSTSLSKASCIKIYKIKQSCFLKIFKRMRLLILILKAVTLLLFNLISCEYLLDGLKIRVQNCDNYTYYPKINLGQSLDKGVKCLDLFTFLEKNIKAFKFSGCNL